METTAMSMPNLGIGSSEPITIPSIPSGSLDISIPMDIDLSALDCFPVNLLQSIDEIPEENGSLSLDFEIDNSIVEVKKVVIVDGLWNMTITNNLPFTITNVDFTISNNSNNLYTTSLLTDIDPYTTKSDPQDITEINPTEIDITYDMLYSALITIDTDHSGEDDVSCPDLDNPPIYICNENPLEFYNFDNTCDSDCDISDCNLIYYCDGNINDAYPNEDCILPNESSETPLIYICGTNIENGYITDYCGGACTEEDCNQIYYCEDNLSGLNLTYIDSNCNTGTDENFVCQNQCIVGSAITCDGECLPGGYVDGWIIDQDISPGLDLSFEYSFNKIGSVIVGLLGIDTTVFSGMPIPGYSGIVIKRAKIDSPNDNFQNQIRLDISNNLFADFILDFDFMNIFNEETGEYLSNTITIDAYESKDTIINFSEYILASGWHNGQFSEDAIDSMIYSLGVSIDAGEYTLNVIENQIYIDSPVFNNIEMSNMSLQYIEAITEDLEFDGIDSPPIEGIPDGFSDFEFNDIIMEIEFFNEIGIPVGLNLELTGTKEGVEEEKLTTINTTIGAPFDILYGCDFNKIGDTARTVIHIDKDSLITEYYCNTTDINPSEVNIETFDSNQSSIVDLMNFAPEIIRVGGGVTINGTGVLAPNTHVWGVFTLITPLAFIFEQPINIIPSESTPIEPMDPSSSEDISSSLIEAALNVIITNKSPIGGKLSLLISDSTIFPLFIDSLITGKWAEQLDFNTMIWDTLRRDLSESGNPVIDSISFTPVDVSSPYPQALEVKFFRNDSLQFFIGRMFELSFPASDSIDYQTGYINPEFPAISMSSIMIDSTRMSWVITDQPRNSIAMITFDGSPIENNTFIPLTLQTTNSIEVQAYLTLQLATSVMNRVE